MSKSVRHASKTDKICSCLTKVTQILVRMSDGEVWGTQQSLTMKFPLVTWRQQKYFFFFFLYCAWLQSESLAHIFKGFVWFPVCICWQVCLGLIRRCTNDILYIKLTVPLYRIWTQQRINLKITYRHKHSKNLAGIFQKFYRVQNSLYACKSWCKCIFHYQCRVSYHWIFTEITYISQGHHSFQL